MASGIELFKRDLWQKKSKFAAALPTSDIDQFLTQTFIYIEDHPRLLDCNANTLFSAIAVCSQMGLAPNASMQLVHLVPFAGEVVVIPGYRGLIELVTRAGKVVDIDAQLVYENDLFEFDLGTSPYIKHQPQWQDDPSQKLGGGKVVAAYAIATFAGGHKKFECIPLQSILDIRDNSAGWKKKRDQSTWGLYFDAMARKTPIRALAKYLPQSLALSIALDSDIAADKGELIRSKEEIKPADAKVSDTKAGALAEFTDAKWDELGSALKVARIASTLSTDSAAGVLGIAPDALMMVESGHPYEPLDGRVEERLQAFADEAGTNGGELLKLLT